MFYLLGAAAGALFLGLSGYSIFCKLCTDLAIPGWTSNVLIGSFFGALNSLGICVLGEYVIRIYDQVRRRPLYLVDRTVNVNSSAKSWHNAPAEPYDDAPYTDLLEETNRLLAESAEQLRGAGVSVEGDANLLRAVEAAEIVR
jgi:hypothetical protein